MLTALRWHKEELVRFDPRQQGGRHSGRLAAETLRPFEVDGWRGCADDLFDSRRTTGQGRQCVRFVRDGGCRSNQPC